VSALAYVLVGHRGIYPAQRLLRTKSGAVLSAALALRDAARQPERQPASDAPPPERDQGTGGVGPASS
jgi:hypothetical protein